ncbi:outer membrane receptor protein involved in Fe transport [Sphingobium xenophagum]|uniref:Outer membrane receptor protein involved in Fe transport n=1 Tax=Sphingobium xenophagum TaxID=121428 RepID=A0ABU1X5I3_SPHXE|nr:TonB-dependent receptor [Sphingobium xenophagum]MDR7156821.1 outer membrane receptor protein involved in Fe transport [Sphingobium xenophagum]
MVSINKRTILLTSAAMGCIIWVLPAQAQTASPGDAGQATRPVSEAEVGEIIVTAQKRAQSVNNVGLSITAVSGDVLASRGISDPSQLTKLVSGFNYNETANASPVYTIRGVGYQDSSIGASPAVTVYVDEVPISYSGGTLGAALDIERVEVLKGPQGTLFGGNATGGAINYIAAKPSDTFTAGVNWDFGRFATSNLTGFVGGPVSDTLSVRLSGRWLKSGSWQESYTRNDKIGEKDQLFGRIIADWEPTDKVKIQLNVNGWRDHSESQAPQLIDKVGTIPGVPLDPAFAAYPFAPEKARAADWDPTRDYRRRDSFKQVSGRLDYSASDDLTLTSISSYQVYKRYNPIDFDGTTVSVQAVTSSGTVKSFYQELRASLTLAQTGNITAGVNYQSDKIDESALTEFPAAVAQLLAGNGFIAENRQDAKTKGVFASADIPILPGLSAVGGIRYTEAKRSYSGCTRDTGDGTAAAGFNAFPPFAPLNLNIQPGECFTIQPNGQPGLFVSSLNEDNVSWRAGLNYKPDRNLLVYANISRGYKAGAYQSLGAIFSNSLSPVVQEQLTAYEIGFKAGLFDRLLQLNGAIFHYDYVDKQIRGVITDPVFGPVEALVNIPKSRVQGFELSASLRPLSGLSLSSAITLADTEVRGSFIGVTQTGASSDFNGEAFPYTPKWSGNADAEYRWALNDRLEAVVGATGSYNSATNGGFGGEALYRIRGYTLVDVRAAIEGDGGKWRAGVWGRNITNEYYWYTATRASDAGTRFAGMPATYGISLTFRY